MRQQNRAAEAAQGAAATKIQAVRRGQVARREVEMEMVNREPPAAARPTNSGEVDVNVAGSEEASLGDLAANVAEQVSTALEAGCQQVTAAVADDSPPPAAVEAEVPGSEEASLGDFAAKAAEQVTTAIEAGCQQVTAASAPPPPPAPPVEADASLGDFAAEAAAQVTSAIGAGCQQVATAADECADAAKSQQQVLAAGQKQEVAATKIQALRRGQLTRREVASSKSAAAVAAPAQRRVSVQQRRDLRASMRANRSYRMDYSLPQHRLITVQEEPPEKESAPSR
eukprot:TRINITY_DN110690_c0_g1_i1.p1 TRINITY_DN110690_c0_g1~~TRINITY_DN110690_c0_g1_i1.p1  ORF type:complete len:316 (+),score=91.44 TRINITY_DN110690_c0_g1_i1:99-950(+)